MPETRYGSLMRKLSLGSRRVNVSLADAAGDAPPSALPLEDPRALFEAAFDLVADLIVICDAQGRLVFLNPAARGLALNDSMGNELDAATWGDWFDDDDRLVPPEEWPLRLALRGEKQTEREAYRVNPDGTRFWMLLSAAPIRDATGRIIGAVATSKDITARKQTEEAARALNEELAQRVGARTAAFETAQRELEREVRKRLDASELLERSRRLLQAIVDRTAAVIYVKDASFRFLLINSQFERIFDRRNADVAGKTDYELFTPDIVAPIRANDERVLSTGEAQYFEEVVPQRDGLHTYVSVKFPLRDDNGVIYAVCGISTDISERKKMEAELSRSQATLATVIESSGDAILLVDRNHQMVMHNAVLNRLFVNVYGIPPRLGVDLRRDVPLEIASRWHALIERALCGERLTVEETAAIDGAVRHLLVSLNPISDGQQVTGVTIFAKDITELRSAEALARQHQAELAHVLRLHTMGAMAASLAHEINQPLGAIANYAQGSRLRLEAGALTAAEIQSTLSEIAREALRAGAITRRVRELVRKGEPTRARADINEIVSAVVDLVAPTARERGVTVHFHPGRALPPVDVDQIQIEQVVLNLVVNALDAVESRIPPRSVEVRTTVTDGRNIEVAVTDNGIGLDGEMLEKVFEPFYTTKPSGLGMGLAISCAIVDAHEGRLWATSNATGGSTFRFVLPIVDSRS